MTTHADDHTDAASWSRNGFVQGLRISLSGMPAMAAFGIAFGTLAAQKGLSLLEATLMSALVFAGASQFVAIEVWTRPMTPAAVVAVAVVTATVNMRFVLMSAALRPWLGALPARQTYPALALMTDPGWLITMRYRAEGGSDAAAFFANGMALWLVWIASSAAGQLFGAHIGDPSRYALDLVLPTYFVALLVPLWRGPRQAIAWAVAGAIGFLAAHLLPGWWFIVLGAIAGSLVADLLHERA